MFFQTGNSFYTFYHNIYATTVPRSSFFSKYDLVTRNNLYVKSTTVKCLENLRNKSLGHSKLFLVKSYSLHQTFEDYNILMNEDEF